MADDVAHMYSSGAAYLSKGTLQWNTSASYKMALFTSAYTPTQTTDTTYTGISSHELSAGAGYTTGGAAVPSITNPSTTGANVILASGNPTWSAASFTGVVTAVLYSTVSPFYLLGYVTYGTAQAAAGGSFSITCPVTGWFEWTVN
jgi:hypothetical protein